MNLATDSLFQAHPDPMWIYDLGTLRFLAVNNAATLKYGFSRAEFLAMTIADIRPDDDLALLDAAVAGLNGARHEAGVWRHRLKSGDTVYVDITSQPVDHDGHPARLVTARDVTRLVNAERLARDALARETALRQSSDALSQQFQMMFASVAGLFLVLTPQDFSVIAVSDSFVTAMGVTRTDVISRPVFEVLPRQPEDVAHTTLRDALIKVVETNTPDLLDAQRFLLPNGAGAQGVTERYWAMSVSAVATGDGALLYVMLRIQDMTDAIHGFSIAPAAPDRNLTQPATVDLVEHTRELTLDNLRLTHLVSILRSTQRMLNAVHWEYRLADDRIVWSRNVYSLYGTTPQNFAHGFEGYVALVHPDDRLAMRSNFADFMASGEGEFVFAHRIRRPDGRIVHVQGLAERSETSSGPVLSGVVQDTTQSMEAAQSLARAKRLLEIAGAAAKFGAWRYDAHSTLLEWSSQTNRIHDLPDDAVTSVDQAIAYYAPEHRQRITLAFQDCLEKGHPFSEIFEIVSSKGHRLWVRSTGEPELDQVGRIVAVQGSFQDITELVTVRKRAEESERLVAMAGDSLKLGGWIISLVDKTVFWSDSVARLHEVPPGTMPSFEGGIDYFAPEDRADARRVIDACISDGIPFDNIRGLITAKGNRITVRSFGVPVRDSAGKIIAVQGAMQDVSELIEARKKADELSISLSETLEKIGDAFFTLDHDWRFTYLNTRAETFLGQKRGVLIGRNILEEFPEVAGKAIKRKYFRATEDGESKRFEYLSSRLGRTFRVHVHPTPKGLAVYFTDITRERKQTEKLRLLEAAVACMNDIVIITEASRYDSPDHPKIVYVNDTFVKLTGFTRAEAIGKTPRLLQGPKTQRPELDRIAAALATQSPVRAEVINYDKFGEEYWLEIDIVPVADATGAVTHFVAIEHDITQRKRSEEALRSSEARFRLIAAATGNAIWEWDLTSGRRGFTSGLTQSFGIAPDADRSQPKVWRHNLHPEDEQRVNETMDKLLAGQIDVMQEQYLFRRGDGKWVKVEDRAFLIRDDEGRPVRVLGSMIDISERLQLEEELRQSQKLHAVGQLTGGVAHDFNNLLTVIMGNLELLQERLDPANPLRQFADNSAKAATRAADLISRLLAFARSQALKPQFINVNETVTGMEDMLRRTLGEDIMIDIVTADGLWNIEADIGQFESGLLNLAINSRDAMPDGGELSIETANVLLNQVDLLAVPDLKPGPYIVITVRDTGQGIAEANIDRVFEPFFTTKSVGKGTGLGLSMVYGFVKQSGGHIRIFSKLHEGTTVELYFPSVAGQKLSAGADVEQHQALRGRETILVVEDDQLILQQVSAQLSDLGYHVLSAMEGERALAILRGPKNIDLLFTDVILPGGMNGRQIADAAMVIRPGLKILFTSGYSENVIVHKGRLDSGVELLSKPYRRSDLAAKIRKVLDA